MPGKINLTNQRFGKLTALEATNMRQHKSVVWKCQCDCGNIHYVAASRLREGSIQSCGCARKGHGIIDLTGQRFGKLVAICKTNQRANKSVIWKCQCDCGNICFVDSHSLQKGNTQSCGCLKSKGELKIISCLQKLNIYFEYQKTFNDCKKENLLPFDFFLPAYKTIIEYDGEQHFKPINFLGGQQRFEQQQQNDQIKNDWCLQHNINLIRIPYTDYAKITEQYIQNLLKECATFLDEQNTTEKCEMGNPMDSEEGVRQAPLAKCEKCVWSFTECPGPNLTAPARCPDGHTYKRDPPDGGYYG